MRPVVLAHTHLGADAGDERTGATLRSMGLRAWSDRLDRRSQEAWRRPFVAPLYLCAALVFLLWGLFVASSPVCL